MTILRFLLGLIVHLDLIAILAIAAGIALLRTTRQRLARRLLAAAWVALAIIPCPVNHLTSGRCDLRSWLTPLAGANGIAWRAAAHEWAGLLYHWLAGESTELWPGPREPRR